MAICGCISYHMEGNHTTWKDFLPRSWISYHIPGFPTTYLNFLPHTLVPLDVAVKHFVQAEIEMFSLDRNLSKNP